MALNVLIVDDSDIIRSMIGRVLKLAEVPIGQLYEAGDGRQALDVLDREWVDLVLADINMPVMDGAQMIEEMRAKPETSDVPVIVVSTEGATERISSLMDKGVAAWVRKPFTPEEIRDVISGVTARPSASEPADLSPDEDMIDRVVGQVFEMFLYSFPERAEQDDICGDVGAACHAELTLSGASDGTIGIAAPRELCTEMAAALLGRDEDDGLAQEKAADALAEVLNIIAGHISTELEAHAPTDLCPPMTGELQNGAWERLATDPSVHAYLVDDRPVLLTVGIRSTNNG